MYKVVNFKDYDYWRDLVIKAIDKVGVSKIYLSRQNVADPDIVIDIFPYDDKIKIDTDSMQENELLVLVKEKQYYTAHDFFKEFKENPGIILANHIDLKLLTKKYKIVMHNYIKDDKTINPSKAIYITEYLLKDFLENVTF